MSSKTAPNLERLNRRAWSLWALMFAVVLALTATVPALYLPMLEMLGGEDQADLWVRNGYTAGIGLSGLVLIFCFYTILKQRELNRLRDTLVADERDLQDARTRLSEMSALFQLSTTLNLQLQLGAILEIIVRRVIATLKAQQASIMIYNPETGLLETRASYGLESEFARNAKARVGQGIAGWVAQQQQAVMLGPDAPNAEMGQHYKRNRNITSALSLPLRVGDRCVGVLNVNRINHPDTFREHHRDMLRLFAEHVGTVVDRAELMDRLGERNRELEASVERLNETNRLKDVFLATASHELKTPLTAVIAHGGTLSVEQRGEFLGRLQSEAQRLLALIEDILDLSRLETGKLTLRREPLTLNAVVAAAVETARATANKHGIAIEVALEDGLPEIEIDEVKMRQVLVNLLVNAIKFSPEKGAVSVRTRRDADFLVVEVADKGPGIRPEEAAHIFELFGQGLRQHDGKTSGLGIGLHLVKRITELHGGHVGVNAGPGGGSTFWVRLPANAASAEPIRKAA
ncbi:MAG: GAF domain-containing sensor histidine kinase [Candidatus Eisenbacteria bacterium]|nr:GAF domain-containing sensor histidine kinase [Candidatus Eisenbacteria bacterium]